MTQVTNAVECEVLIEARPETIFSFFTDPEKLIRWKGLSAAINPTPGGDLRIEITATDIAIGSYVEVTPPTRIVFTWGWQDENNPIRPGSSTVEVTLTPEGNATRVRLVHSGLPDEAMADHTEGWNHFLERLAIVAAGGDPGPDPWAMPPAE